jgi:hypothetical protein
MGVDTLLSSGQGHPHSSDFLMWLISPIWPYLYLGSIPDGARPEARHLWTYWTVFVIGFFGTMALLSKKKRGTSQAQ